MGQSAVRGKRLKRADQIVAVADQLLGDEGVPLYELIAALKARGIHAADSSEVWVILTERGVAEMSGAETRRLRGSHQIAPLREETRVTPVPAGWPARARELAEAVCQELKESAARLNLQDVPVSDGERLVVTETRVLYRFDVQGELPSGEGATVTFLPDGTEVGDQYEAEIVSVFGSEVTLALPTEAPAVRSGRLRCDLTWLLISQRERLREVEEGVAGFNAEAALSLTQVDWSPGGDLSEVEPIQGLNDQQSRAVAQARRFGTTWLWGPPGTGKTTTVAAIVEKLVVEDQCRVLLVAPTNVAVDVAVGAVLRRIPSRAPGLVARLGPPVHGELFDHADGRVLVDEIAADRGSEVADRRVAVGQEIAALRSSLRALRAADRHDAVSRREVEAELADKQALARDLDGLLRELRRQVCRDAGLVAATTHQVLLGTLKGLPFDAVIIDEGSMVPSSLAALVAGSGCGHTIVAGDFRQLPPVTQSEAPEVLRWLRRSPFESCGVEKAVRSGESVAGLVSLREQHRMRAAISDMVSAAFYPESPLVTADSVLGRSAISSSSAWPNEPVVLIDTSDLRSRVSRRQGQWSRLNIAHAQIAAGIAERLATDDSDLALISPFAPQAKLLGAFAGPNTRASTVHRYQGSEAQTVVFDAVDTKTSVGKLHPWFARGELGSDGSRLVNVAASRAKDQFVLLADMGRVLRERNGNDAVSRFLRQVDRQSVALTWRDAIDGAATGEEYTPLAALLSALESPGEVEMFLPLADVGRVKSLLKNLDAFRLVDAAVWMTPSDAQGESGRLLAQAGAYVRPLMPIPESVVVVGDTVITAGSSVLGASPGIALQTTHQEFATVVRRVLRRRSTGSCPGSGEPADRCGLCSNWLVRIGSPRRGPRYGCLSCGA